MIIGTGSDLIDINRIARTLEKFGDRFIQRVFTPVEIAKAERRRGAGLHIHTYAKRFAAKEACSKALGTGFNEGVYMRDIGVINDPTGRPTLALTGGAARRLQFLLPEGMVASIHLTLTDEPPTAFAGVLIEALPGRPVRDY